MKNWSEKMPVDMEPVDVKFGDHMAVGQFIIYVESGFFVDSDGFGHLATVTMESREEILPSHVRNGRMLPEWATHVVWYNR